VKPKVFLAAAFLVLAGVSRAAAPDDVPDTSPALLLPAFTTVDLGFSVRYSADSAGRTTQARVTEVREGSLVWKKGLRRNDTLKAINGKPLVGLKGGEIDELTESNLNPGESKTYTFVRVRGFILVFTKTLTLTVTISPNAPAAAVRS
jgi:C-terminal processing protease CtpA/Prc